MKKKKGLLLHLYYTMLRYYPDSMKTLRKSFLKIIFQKDINSRDIEIMSNFFYLLLYIHNT